MASPAALLGIAYFAVIFTKVSSSPFWSQPDCPDQGQIGYWSGSDYESQGPSYQQTLQAMVEETIRCIQQVIQVTKREMTLLLRQLAEDADCSPPGNIQAVPYGDVASGQNQFPPADSGYNYDRPQEQLQYPAQLQPSDPLIQPQVQIHYQPQELQETTQTQPQYVPDSRPVLDTDSYVINCNSEHTDYGQQVPSSTVKNKISSFGAYEKSPVSSENAYTKPQTHAEFIERPIKMENDSTSNTFSEGIQSQPEKNGLVPPNSNLSNTISNNIPILTHSDLTTSTLITNISHDIINDYSVTDSTPDTSTQGLTSTEKPTLNDEVQHENSADLSNSSSTVDLLNTSILIHGAPISLFNFTSTTDRNNNTTDNNYSENTLKIPSPMNNEVDVNMENLPDKHKTNYTNLLNLISNVTPSTIRPNEQTQSNNTVINPVTFTYNNSAESTESNPSKPQQSMKLETTTKILVELSTFGNSTDETATEISGESGSTLAIDKHGGSPNVSSANSTDTSVLRRKSKL